jgi:hypothetical protein
MGVFDGWDDWQEGDYLMAESMSIDLTTAEGFAALEERAANDVHTLYIRDEHGWNMMAGRTPADVAAQLANDLMQESVSLPRSAFADPQVAGRELAVLRNVATFVYRVALERAITHHLSVGYALPSGRPTPAPAPSEQSRRHTSRK